MASISFKMEYRLAQEQLARLGLSLSATSVLKVIGQRLLSWVNTNFEREGAERHWEPLSPATLAARRKKGRDAKILRDRGTLSQSFVYRLAGSTGVRVGTTIFYAPFHHFGTPAYTIRPKSRKMLRWVGPGGEYRFARKVNHPGIRPRPLLPSDNLARELGRQTLQAMVDKVTSDAGH